MEIKITKDQKNPFFERREIEFLITQKDSTPSKEEVEKILATKTKSKTECVLIEHIYQKFGKLESVGIAKIYNKPVEKKVEVKKEKNPEEKVEEKPAESKEEKKEVKEELKEKIPEKEEKPKEKMDENISKEKVEQKEAK